MGAEAHPAINSAEASNRPAKDSSSGLPPPAMPETAKIGTVYKPPAVRRRPPTRSYLGIEIQLAVTQKQVLKLQAELGQLHTQVERHLQTQVERQQQLHTWLAKQEVANTDMEVGALTKQLDQQHREHSQLQWVHWQQKLQLQDKEYQMAQQQQQIEQLQAENALLRDALQASGIHMPQLQQPASKSQLQLFVQPEQQAHDRLTQLLDSTNDPLTADKLAAAEGCCNEVVLSAAEGDHSGSSTLQTEASVEGPGTPIATSPAHSLISSSSASSLTDSLSDCNSCLDSDCNSCLDSDCLAGSCTSSTCSFDTDSSPADTPISAISSLWTWLWPSNDSNSSNSTVDNSNTHWTHPSCWWPINEDCIAAGAAADMQYLC